jgi:hypothetical protein
MRGEPQTTWLDRLSRLIATALGRPPKPAPAYARVRRQPIDPRRDPRY